MEVKKVKYRPKIPTKIKEKILAEANYECANPGCHNTRVHIHHIRVWAIYQCHDKDYMIAVCPTCHDAIHNGSLPIDEIKLLQWKTRHSSNVKSVPFIYSKPSHIRRITCGSLNFQGDGTILFELQNGNRLSFRVDGENNLVVNSKIVDLAGNEIISVVNSYVHVRSNYLTKVDHYPGRIRVRCQPHPNILPPNFIKEAVQISEEFIQEGLFVLFDMEITEPGIAQIKGVWPSSDSGVFIDGGVLAFMRGDLGPIKIEGQGPESIMLNLHPHVPIFGFKR